MAPVLAKLVKVLAILCFLAAGSMLTQTAIWGLLSFTDVRERGVAAVTQPVPMDAASAPKAQPVGAKAPSRPVEQAKTETVDAAESADAPPSGTDTVLLVVTGAATAVGIGSLALLPVVLLIGFVTALVRAPRAAASCMGGALWGLGLIALALPWASLFPQVPWSGIFHSYDALLLLVAEAETTGGPLRAAPLVLHVAVPSAAILVLVGIAWRCGEALHLELLAAESLAVDASLERDAARTAAKGAFVPTGRTASSLALAAGSPLPSEAPTSDLAEELLEAPPRRLI